jgi:hypothetical protein
MLIHFFLVLMFVPQALDVVPVVGKPEVSATRQDGIGEQARFGQISAMWNVGPNLYIADGPTVRRLNLQTLEVSTLSMRAGSGRRLSAHARNSYGGLADLWSDGIAVYATDIGSGTIRRILISTGEVDNFSPGGSVSWGLTGNSDSLLVANANTREILRLSSTKAAFMLQCPVQ